MTTPWDGNTVSSGQTIQLYDIPSLQAFVKNVNDNYYKLDSTDNFEKIKPYRDENDEIMPIEMVITKLTLDDTDSSYNFTETSLKVLDEPNSLLRASLKNWKSFSLGW